MRFKIFFSLIGFILGGTVIGFIIFPYADWDGTWTYLWLCALLGAMGRYVFGGHQYKKISADKLTNIDIRLAKVNSLIVGFWIVGIFFIPVFEPNVFESTNISNALQIIFSPFSIYATMFIFTGGWLFTGIIAIFTAILERFVVRMFSSSNMIIFTVYGVIVPLAFWFISYKSAISFFAKTGNL